VEHRRNSAVVDKAWPVPDRPHPRMRAHWAFQKSARGDDLCAHAARGVRARFSLSSSRFAFERRHLRPALQCRCVEGRLKYSKAGAGIAPPRPHQLAVYFGYWAVIRNQLMFQPGPVAVMRGLKAPPLQEMVWLMVIHACQSPVAGTLRDPKNTLLPPSGALRKSKDPPPGRLATRYSIKYVPAGRLPNRSARV
jgi:hypothetical protein